MIDGFIFDMDGILFDTERIWNECWAIAGREFGVENIEYYIKSCVGLTSAETKKFCMESMQDNFLYDRMLVRTRELFSIRLEEGGMPVKPGVYLMLEYLKTNRYPVGLASSSTRKSVMHHLEAAHMTEYFSTIVAGDDVEKGKPAPDIYLKVLELLNLNNKNVIAFEDSPNGLKSATAAEIKAIMIPDQIPYSGELKPYVYEKFNSMTAALEALKKGEIS